MGAGVLDFSIFSCDFPAMTLDIKICGLKTEEALAAALGHGASHVGFIFFPKSPRNIAPCRCWTAARRSNRPG